MDRLLAALGAGAGETRFVGGCVRDTLLGLEASDVDLATRIAPEEVIRRLEAARIKAVPTGLAHGTITAVIGGKPVEVTTLRRDVATDGRRATVEYTEDWREDAARRDFTINALSADPASGEVFDYFGGLADLGARVVRFIGEPLQRIAEDHLRILRFFRFHARFARGTPDPPGLEACAARANDLMALSRERIADELLKLLALPDPAPTVRLMIERGIFRPILPEIETADRLALLPRRERAAGVAPDPVRRLGALLPRGGDQYSDGGWKTASEVGARLRLSIAARTRLTCMVTHRVDTGDDARLLAYQVGLPCAIDRMLLEKRLDTHEAAARIRALEGWQRPRLPVKGGDLIAMGLEAGPSVSKTMQAIEREWMVSGFSTDKAEVRAMARRHVDQALRSSQ
ncbi:MAG TPA: CCA tRNA nucleotidyltransferase [Allosphingosinicella sp.]|nr:CCA tRNA nucleotidyltransferase [Allosphingosinicella sp.]